LIKIKKSDAAPSGPWRSGHGFGRGPQSQNWRSSSPTAPWKPKATFVENVTIPERSVVGQSQSLLKTWRITNAGTTDWPEGTKLIFLRGDRTLSSEEEYPVPPCKAGQTVDVSALILTPATSGRYTTVFRLADGDRTPFGPRLWCDLVVTDPSSASPKEAAAPPKVEVLPKLDSIPAKPEILASIPDIPKLEPKAEVTDQVDIAKSEGKADGTKPAAAPKYAIQMQALSNMGFTSEDLNLDLLEKNNGNVQKVCEFLLAMRE